MLEQTKIENNKLIFLLMVVSVWTGFGLFFGTQNYVRDIYVGKAASLPGYIVGWLLCGYTWAILTLPVLRFVRRFSLGRLGWSRFFLVHIPASTLFSLVQLGMYVGIAGTLFGTAGRGYWEFYKFIAVSEFQSSFLVYFAFISAVTAYDRWFRTATPDPVKVYDPEPSQNGHTSAFLRRIPVKENGRIASLMSIISTGSNLMATMSFCTHPNAAIFFVKP